MKRSHLIQAVTGALCVAALTLSPTASIAAGAPYLSGGVGIESRAEMEAQARKFNLHVEFARTPDGAYFSDVDVVVKNSAGKTVLNVKSAGPLVYSRLPPGTYRVQAVRDGVPKKAVVQVAKRSTKRVILSWKD